MEYENEYGDIVTECRDCYGTGEMEAMYCLRPASYCCGGCYETEICDQCGGTGEIILIENK